MTDLALTDVAAATSGLRREGILASAERLEFTHPLIHTAIHADIPETDRGLGHLRAARLLAADGEESRVPSHLLVAEPNGDPWVVDQLSEAAAKAASGGAPGTAVVLLRRALIEPPAQHERRPLGLRLGQALALSGDLDAAADALRVALDLAGTSDARVEIALVLGRVLRMTDRIPEAIAVLDDAAGRLPAGRREEYLSLEMELAIAGHMGRPAKDWVDRFAGAVTRATGTSPADRTLRGFYGYVAASTGTETAAEVSRLARSSITALGQPDQPMMLQGVAAGLAMSGAFAEALDVLDRALAITQEAGDAVQFGFLSMTRTWVAHRSGRVLEGEADAQAILDIPSIGHLYASYAVAHVAVAMMERGSVDDATRLMADHGYLDTTELDSLPGAVVHHVRGRLHRLSGRPKEAVADYRRCRQTVLTAGFVGPAFGEWRMDGALAHLALGQRDEAREIVFEDLELARSFGAPREIGIALRTSGLVEGGAAGLERLAESVDVLATSEAVLDHAKALVEHGAALRRAGRNTAAADRLRSGLDLASRCAATATVTRAQDELRAAGSRPRRERLSGPDSLTASELRVARMAAEGRSNPEIAQLLFVTRRTVEVHLTHVYRKLEIASRDDLASALDLS
jgi:DNA-binding CsgD family transcriptional regulator